MISLDHVTKRYAADSEPALDDVTLDIGRGEFAFLIGSSGSGKSTLLRLLTRELIATSGEVHVAGRNLSTLPARSVPALRRDIGIVFQDFRLLDNKTVFQNVAFVLQVLGTRRHRIRRLVPEALEVVGLDGLQDRRPMELSGGEQQRVAIARAIVKKPAILLADEPTGNLDPETSVEIVKLLERINKQGTTLLVATHDQSIVDDFRKRVVELKSAKLVRDELGGSYLDLYRDEDEAHTDGASARHEASTRHTDTATAGADD